MSPLTSEGRGHKFESCRARQVPKILASGTKYESRPRKTAPEDCAVVTQERSRDFGRSTSDVEQLALATMASIKVEPGNDSRRSLEFRPEKTVRSQVVMKTMVACWSELSP